MPKTVKLLIAVLCTVLAGSLLTPVGVASATSTVIGGVPIIGTTYQSWKAAGGTATFGKPLAARVSATIGSRTGYLQRFAKGQVFTSSLGNQTFTYPSTIKLTKVTNERDALARWGFAKGVLLRTAQLTAATKLDRLKLATELKGGLIIDLRTASAVKRSPDPTLPKVTRANIPIDADAVYYRYVTVSERRKAFAKALRRAAAAKGAVLIHCTAGKDRTGWAVAMIMFAVGASKAQVRSEYLRTSGADIANLNSGLSRAIAKYGTIKGYLRTGLGLTTSDLSNLKKKFG
jgi:protein-tyrosine phosphatase